MLTELSNQIYESAAEIGDACLKAREEVKSEAMKEQFDLAIRSIIASSTCFNSSINNLKDKPNEYNYLGAQVFSEALVGTCNAIVTFATASPALTGIPATFSAVGKDKLSFVFASCMEIVAPCILVCSLIKDLNFTSKQINSVQNKIIQCQVALEKGSVRLAESLGITSIDIM